MKIKFVLHIVDMDVDIDIDADRIVRLTLILVGPTKDILRSIFILVGWLYQEHFLVKHHPGRPDQEHRVVKFSSW